MVLSIFLFPFPLLETYKYYQAEQLIDEFNYELAQKFCQRALEMEPDNVRALETSSSLLLELGDMESAKHVSNANLDLHLLELLVSKALSVKKKISRSGYFWILRN